MVFAHDFWLNHPHAHAFSPHICAWSLAADSVSSGYGVLKWFYVGWVEGEKYEGET